ncbi:hypothetical protein, conserved [Eimeria necatrix]|uniref:Calcineurin-like phosphoesterase domain-containing protein n=1 Tax=Eimeria necatrix TaxID=51315 RepID=U6MM94_9EIME|nr:hypothetical protein, conserved [Eimeria necatrix]CDJ63559.1 hypothetical protein, conserved [Eimeria necatrix]
MRIFAWSDLHLESKVNFELVKQFCQLNRKRTDSAEASLSTSHGSSYTSGSENNCPGTSKADAAAAEQPTWPPLAGSLVGNIEHLWEVVTGATAPLKEDFTKDVLILAGDVHHELEGLKDSLELFCSVFGHVTFVPGNHELWVTHKDRDMGIGDSLQKFDSILRLCESLGIHTKPFSPSKGVRLVPLFSWYDELDPHFRRAALIARTPLSSAPGQVKRYPRASNQGGTSREGSRAHSSKLLLSLAENWMDYSACSWPHPLSNNDPKSGSRQCMEGNTNERHDPEAVLSKRFTGMCLGKSRRYQCRTENLHRASTASVTVALPHPDAGLKETALLCGSRWAKNASSKSPHQKVPVEKAREAACKTLDSCAPRRFTDAWGMPLSLAEFFAAENERRDCFVRNTQKHTMDATRSGRTFPNVARKPPFPDLHDATAAVDFTAEAQVGQKVSSESAKSLHAVNSEMEASSSPEKLRMHEYSCCDDQPVVITFSHFLPRAELATLYPLKPSALAYVMGSSRIDEQLRQADGSLHVFGHSHVNIDHKIEVRALGRTPCPPSSCKCLISFSLVSFRPDAK